MTKSVTIFPQQARWLTQGCNNSVTPLVILFSLKTTVWLGNGLQPQSGVTPLF